MEWFSHPSLLPLPPPLPSSTGYMYTAQDLGKWSYPLKGRGRREQNIVSCPYVFLNLVSYIYISTNDLGIVASVGLFPGPVHACPFDYRFGEFPF